MTREDFSAVTRLPMFAANRITVNTVTSRATKAVSSFAKSASERCPPAEMSTPVTSVFGIAEAYCSGVRPSELSASVLA